MDLRKLRHVLALDELGNFARAADAVHLTQPAFSRSIQSLEQDLGVPLFVRGKRKITPTPFGEVVLKHARRMLWEADGLRRDVAMIKAKEIGEVTFGMGPMPAAMLLVRVLSRLTRDSPGVRTKVHIMHWNRLLQLLEAEKLDFFIADCRELASGERLSISLMPKFPIKCFCRAGHPILRKKAVRSADLFEYPLGCFQLPAVSLAEVTNSLCYAGDPQNVFSLQCDSLLVTGQLAAQTDMIIFGPQSAFRNELQANALVEVELAQPLALTTHFGVVALRNRILSPAAELIISIVGQELLPATQGTEAVPSPRWPSRARPPAVHVATASDRGDRPA